MNRFRLSLAAFGLCGFAGYLAYQIYLPSLLADGITTTYDLPVPERLRKTFNKVKEPLNDAALIVVETAHESGVTIDDLLYAIDNTTQEQALSLLAELNETEIISQDQFFDIAKKHIPTSFDAEVFREPFKQRVSLEAIKKTVRYANHVRKRDELDASTVKSIAKRILLQKQAEVDALIQK